MIDFERARRTRRAKIAADLRLGAAYVPELVGGRTAALLLEGAPYLFGDRVRVMLVSADLSDVELERAADLCAFHAGEVYYRLPRELLEAAS